MLYIGIDLGTSAVKLLLIDDEGNIINTVSRTYEVIFPKPGWSEQNPQDWIREVKSGIKELIKDHDAGRIKAVAAAGQMHGLVALDENDNVIRPAILWNDGRTSEETAYLNNVIGKEKLTEYTANIAFDGFTAPKLLWLKKHEPENFGRIKKIMLPKDYINYKLTGVHCTDYSDASGMLLLDVKNKKWSEPMLDICGINRTQMPELFESYEPVGKILPEIAAEIGLGNDVIVAAGAGDNAAAAIGTGITKDGGCNISLGTSGTIFIASDSFKADKNNALHSFAHANGRYHLMGCMLSAASCYQWWLKDVLDSDGFVHEQSMITQGDLGKNNVFFLPYLMGERSPLNDTNARGTFTGITMSNGRRDMTQAVLEGVAFGIRDSLEAARKLGIKTEKSCICGGGAKSGLWTKMISNICNLELEKMKTEQGPGYGAAILAMVAADAYKSVDEAIEKLIETYKCDEPESELVSLYDKQYEKFGLLYPALKDVFAKIK